MTYKNQKVKSKMRKGIIALIALFTIMGTCTLSASTATDAHADSTTFAGRLENADYKVFIVMDFYKNNVTCPGNDIFGEVPGYFGAHRDPRKWIIEDAKVEGHSAKLVIINDYGSEDLDARLTRNHDGTYTLERLSGSTMKIVVNNEWVKIPKKLVFKKVK